MAAILWGLEEKMYASPKVSVIIPTYNCATYIVAAIESALAQTYQNVEIVIVDDGSTDNTPAVLQPFLSKIKYVWQRNRGLSIARNVGIKHAGAELIAFLDADDLWHSEKLQLQIQAFQQYPGAGLSFTNYQFFNDMETLRTPGWDDRFFGWFNNHQTPDSEIAYGSIYRDLLDWNCFHVSSVVVTRDALEKVGLFDEEFKICQDFDLWLRISRQFPVLGINRPLSEYRYRPDSLSGSTQVRSFRWQEETAMVLTKHLRNDCIASEFKGGAKSTLSRLSWEVGWMYFSQNHLKKARTFFGHWVYCQPFSMKRWIYWAVCFLPVPILEGLRWLKRRQSAKFARNAA